MTTRTLGNYRLSALVIMMVGFGVFALGRSASAITVVPPSVEFGAQKGETLTTDIKLYNESNDPTTLFTSAANFTAKDQDGTPNFDFVHTTTDLASWITTSPSQVTLQPNDRATIHVTIHVPANADPGGHYAAVFFGTEAPKTSGSAVTIASKVGSLIILRVAGAVHEAGKIQNFTFSTKDSFFTHPPVGFDVHIQNSGNVHFRPTGNITITNMFGGQTAVLPLNTAEGAVLPNSVRRFETIWGKSDSNHGFFGAVKSEWNHFALGTYTASLKVSYGSTNQKLTSELKFMVFPWQLLLVEFIVVIMLLLGLVLGIKNYNAMIIRQARGAAGPRMKR